MWGSFKAAFAATVGAMLAYGLICKLGEVNLDDVKEVAGEIKDKASEAWTKSRKISDPGRDEMHVN
jgi:ArsR family metal-binding transcriptional regulator